MHGPKRAKLGDGRRWHFQHGPIDLVLEAFGEPTEIHRACEQAWHAFEKLLDTLVEELAVVRRPVGGTAPFARGPVARRMVEAVWPHRSVFVTPMAAVAGAVADEVLEAMVANRGLERAYVNDGGDIALFLRPGHRFEAGIVTRPESAAIDVAFTIEADMPVRGIATSGRGGRSLSFGIADSVSVLATNAAAADVAATLIANAIDVDHPGIERVAATELDPDSDLGDRRVTLSVGRLDEGAVAEALDRGAQRAERMRLGGLIEAAWMSLAGRSREVSPILVRT